MVIKLINSNSPAATSSGARAMRKRPEKRSSFNIRIPISDILAQIQSIVFTVNLLNKT
jgi:hypothetical protein